MLFVREIEDSDRELLVRGNHGSGPVLFYTGVSGIVAGIAFSFIQILFGQVFVLVSAVATVAGFVLARQQTALEVDHEEGQIRTETHRWDMEDASAIVLSEYRQLPAHLDDTSNLTKDVGTRVWRVHLYAARSVRDRNLTRSKLDRVLEDADQINVLELDERLDAVGGEIILQVTSVEQTADAAARAARHLAVPLYDFATGSAPRRLESDSLAVNAFMETVKTRDALE